MTWNAFPGRPTNRYTLGFLARISPDGRHVLATVNEALYVRNFTDYKILQVFYPTRGILAWYSRDDDRIQALPGAADPDYVHCDPVWSSDGKTIVFARAKARDPYDPSRPVAAHSGDPNETPIQYDLYRMPFNGGRGGTPEPIRGASANGTSNSFPKITPDGRWVVFVRSRNGQLLRPDGTLWIVPLAGGEPPPPPPPPSVAEDCDVSTPVSEAEEIVLQFTVKYLRLIQALDQKWHAKIDLIELPLNINLPTTCPYIKSLSNIKTLCQFLSDRTDDWSKKLLAVE